MPVNSISWLQHTASVPDVMLNHIQLDSRKVSEGDVFVAIAGTRQHGNSYISDALTQGAALVLTDSGQYSDQRIVVIPELQTVLPELVARFYQQPSQHLQLVGITGTNGKSSTALFINQLADYLAVKSAVIGTLGFGTANQLQPLNNTTPHFTELQRILAGFVANDVQLVAMEVSSHALSQQRVAGLSYQVAVFTNLTRDHLDYHGTMQQYAAAKAQLFRPELAQAAVINVSDEFGRQLATQCTVPVWVYGEAKHCHGYPRYLAYSDVQATENGYQFLLTSQSGEYMVDLPLLGEFNIQNVLAAFCSLLVLGYDITTLIEACSKLTPVPGRMEQFHFPQRYTAVIDYAHTPDALQQALQSLRAHCRGHVWCVFGCGGDRDTGKRPVMGQLSELYAEHIIITADNPRSEDVMAICEQIAQGMSPDANYQIEPDRKTAIKLALVSAQPGDIILIAGKGHETIQIIGSEQLQYDERGYLRQLQQEMAQ